jgi:L-rhamnose isomerase
LPFGAVWEAYCEKYTAPDDLSIVAEVTSYERNVLKERM